MEDNNTLSPVGIKGWLLLVAIFVTCTPIRIAYETYKNFYLSIIKEQLWEPLTNPASQYYIPYFKGAIFFELSVNIFLIVAWICVGFLFFTKKRIFKKTFITMLIINLAVIVIDQVLVHLLNIQAFGKEAILEIARSFIVASIWGLYTLKSKRVTNTFIH